MTTTTLALFFLAGLALAMTGLWLRDHHALRRTQRDLASDRDRLRYTLRSAGVAVWSWDIQGDSITWDETCSQLFGFVPGEAPRNIAGFGTLVHPEDLDRVQKAVGKTVETGAEYNVGFRVVWPDGTVRHLATRARIEKDAAGLPARLAGLTWDATEQRLAAEELHAANQKLQQSLAELDQRSRENALLAQMTDLLQSCTSPAEAQEIIAQFCGRLFPSAAGALFIFSASRNLVQAAATWNDPDLPAPDFGPDDCWALRQGHEHYIDAANFAMPCHHLKGARRDSHLCVPMMAHGTGVGVLYLQNLRSTPAQPFLGIAERRLCSTVAKQSALALANLNLRDTLRSQSIRDPLTGLFNRRYLEDSLERELHRMARRKHSAGFVMLDIDHFKAFNDAFGHEGGDAVLRAFGAFLKERLRREDIACRYGGEEFCIVFAESSLEDAVRRCENLRAEAKLLIVQHGGSHLPPLAVSIGVAGYPTHGDTVPALVAAADAALYQAKAEGRDRVVVATAEESTGGE
jgi:diguanylate cyclase (GGDEF)-like protein